MSFIEDDSFSATFLVSRINGGQGCHGLALQLPFSGSHVARQKSVGFISQVIQSVEVRRYREPMYPPI